MLRRKLWIGICVFVFLLLLAGSWVYRSATLGPDFYRRSLEIEASVYQRAGEELEDRYLDAHNCAVRNSSWSLELTDKQVNGWLASTLVQKYPRFQPTKIDNIRSSFQANRMRIAFRVKDTMIPIVVCVDVVPYITADENSIAIRLEQIRTGVVPLPKRQASDQISQALSRMEIPIAWTIEKGHPLGLIPSVFEMPKGIDRKVHIQNIEIQDGKLILSGSAMDST